MQVRNLLIGAIALSLTTPVMADPVKPEPAAAPAAARPAEVVLASAGQVPAPLPEIERADVAEQAPAAPAPAKKRAARVTTCRCADQTAQR